MAAAIAAPSLGEAAAIVKPLEPAAGLPEKAARALLTQIRRLLSLLRITSRL
jgi:hypothetical protein